VFSLLWSKRYWAPPSISLDFSPRFFSTAHLPSMADRPPSLLPSHGGFSLAKIPPHSLLKSAHLVVIHHQHTPGSRARRSAA
jgi:hypothetical protein